MQRQKIDPVAYAPLSVNLNSLLHFVRVFLTGKDILHFLQRWVFLSPLNAFCNSYSKNLFYCSA